MWYNYIRVTSNPGTEDSVVLVEAYSFAKALSMPFSLSSFPYRQSSVNVVAIPWYSDASLD